MLNPIFSNITNGCETFSPEPDRLPVAIIGAGPVGLAAAAQLFSKGEPFMLFEAGNEVAANIRKWEHIRLFSPWQYNIDKFAKALLNKTNWVAPQNEEIPTGKELIEHYLKPLAALPELSPNLYLNTKVTAISRKGLSKVKTNGREKLPFVIHTEQHGSSFIYEARAVIDSSGTWSNPNPLRSDGICSDGEKAFRENILYGIPDVLGKEKNRYSGKKVLVVGSGHSAINTLLELVELQKEESETEIVWAIRKANIEEVYGGRELDGLRARGELGIRLQTEVETGKIKVLTAYHIENIQKQNGQIQVSGMAKDERVVVEHIDEIVSNTGSRPDLSIMQEVRVLIDPSLECAYELAPLIDPNLHSCGTVRPHGEKELRHPEKDFYIAGAKSYGRAPTFLMATGYEQVRSIVAALVGDMDSAQKVELELPETGVCKVNAKRKESYYELMQAKEVIHCCISSKSEKKEVKH
ncbi:NAD(P)-binding domain-containing protein [Saccharibacillus sp. JS10]|uniref:NAD(P)-binding domain-containing protein n=1 Tax=Saccharibacillus sp. JS10 TaxID=2950552 RepID=UPI00210EC4AA|nr:NAD(P)-binding domain-containing protein [Saccharibacillus sp. JS10]MCQ4086456.1 NAD(P)-binding domain-containing protein [Saccharibacillus sp. JS10]